jgi:glutathione S-transferase
MSQFKLTYFNLNAVAEPVRWLFKVAKVDFIDERIDPADWPTLKTSGRFPLAQVPLLEFNGKVYNQSGAFIKYLAKRYGFLTGDDVLNLRVDQVHDIVDDGVTEFRKWVREHEDEKKAELKNHLKEDVFPMIFKQLEEIVSTSGGKYVAGSKLTYADFVLANWFKIFNELIDPTLKERYQALADHLETVLNIPEIKAHVKNRPEVLF